MANDEIEALTTAIGKAPDSITKAELYLERGRMYKNKGESDMAAFDLAFADYNEARKLALDNEEIVSTVAAYFSATFAMRARKYVEKKAYAQAIEDCRLNIKLSTTPMNKALAESLLADVYRARDLGVNELLGEEETRELQAERGRAEAQRKAEARRKWEAEHPEEAEEARRKREARHPEKAAKAEVERKEEESKAVAVVAEDKKKAARKMRNRIIRCIIGGIIAGGIGYLFGTLVNDTGVIIGSIIGGVVGISIGFASGCADSFGESIGGCASGGAISFAIIGAIFGAIWMGVGGFFGEGVLGAILGGGGIIGIFGGIFRDKD
jgi:tetratricopeptide (TPR) repeat protein